MSPSRQVVAALVAVAFLLPAAASAQLRYLAFGDSITAGVGDDPARTERGYPPRLEDLLVAAGQQATVENHGLSGETTAEGVSRIDGVLAGGGDVLLLMEGTNDVGARVSVETIRFNLDRMAEKAEAAGLEVVHATLVPRLPSANTDGRNRITGDIAGQVRDMAWLEERGLADPFAVFVRVPGGFEQLYVGGEDKLHPNAAGYDLLAQVFADVLTGVDSVVPVTGLVAPIDDAQEVPPGTEIQVDLYDFGAGIDVGATSLSIDDVEVPATITGDQRKLEIRYRPPQPFSGVVFVGLETQDLANPPHVRDGQLLQFVVAGTVFLDGDIDRDGRVDGVDLVAFAVRFGARRGDGRFRNFADFNDDGVIDGVDLALLAGNFGRRST